MNYDNLEIGISAKTTSAVNSIKKLSDSLSTLSSNLNKVDASKFASLSNGMQDLATGVTALKNATQGGTANISTLATNLTKLSNLSASSLNGVTSAIKKISDTFSAFNVNTQAVGSIYLLSNSLSQLGGANVTKAVAGMGSLSIALSNLLTEISKAPAVSNNVIRLIDSLARLTSNGQKVSSTANVINNAFNTLSKSSFKLRFRFTSLSSIIGKIYGELWLLIRAFKTLGSAIRTAMNYTETLNYFNKAFNNVATKAVGNWEDLGYKSAEAYYNSFAERASQVTSQMARLTVGADGTFQLSSKTLGLGGNATAKYQAQFAQLASSMGVSSENAITLSEVMTKLGGDLSSIRDEDIQETWGRMSSGLLGMARSMDRYGANVRIAGLDQKLLELGIDASAKNLSQQDKMLLRVITTLDSTKFAWTDMIGTLYENANQLKLLKSGWSDLTTIIGGMFAPALRGLLPILNAVLVVLQRLALFVGNLFGLNVGSPIKDMGDDFSGISDALDDIDSSATGAGGSVKKLKDQLLGIDELNVIKTKDDSGGGGAGGVGSLSAITEAFNKATQEYLEAWKKAFDDMEDKISKFANAIENSEAVKTIKQLFKDIKDGNWEGVGGDVSKLFTISVDGFTKLLTSTDWGQIGRNVADFLVGVDWSGVTGSLAKLIWAILKGSIDFVAQMYIELFFKTADKKLSYWIGYILGTILGWLKKEIPTWPDKIKDMLDIWQMLEDIETDVRNFFDLLKVDASVAFAYIASLILSKFSQSAVSNNLNGMKTGFSGVLATVGINTSTSLANILDSIRTWFSSDKVKEKLSGVGTAFTNVFNTAKSNVSTKVAEIKQKIVDYFGSGNTVANWITGAYNGFKSTFDSIKNYIVAVIEAIKKAINDTFSVKSNFNFSGLLDAVKEVATQAGALLSSALNVSVTLPDVPTTPSGSQGHSSTLTPAVTPAPATKPKNNTSGDERSVAKATVNSAQDFLSRIGKFASGGFPQAGSLFWAGEAGPELIGTIGGGNATAVASNGEITGISDTIRSTSSQEMGLLRQQNELLMAILNKPGLTSDELFNSVRTSANNYTQMTGNLAF